MKLAKLPERSRVRLIVQISPALHERLTSYADLYAQTYGACEDIPALVPFMIEAFLDEDKSFGKAPQKSNRMRATKKSGNTVQPASEISKGVDHAAISAP